MDISYLNNVGGTITYPRDVYDVTFLADLSFAEAIAEVVASAPDAQLGLGFTATQVQQRGDPNEFLNKLAVCVAVTTTHSIAIYQKDNKFHRIQAVRKAGR
ncbi:MAG: hypothetical protein K2W95_32375 [Candidatus Obscuribacterales bacterium]|nr:hypothetical protein [Candidatus Obscuribacterales bacterium]